MSVCLNSIKKKKATSRNYNIPLVSKQITPKENQAKPSTIISTLSNPIPPKDHEPPVLPHQKHIAETARTIIPAIKTLVIGIGGLGGHAVTYLHQNSPYKFDTCAVDTNAKDLYSTESKFRILLGKNELKGLGTGIEPKISAKLTRNALPELEVFIKQHGYEKIFAIAGGGGGTGSGALPVISEYAKQNSLRFIPCLTMPFNFEGNKKYNIAWKTLETMQDIYPEVFIAHQEFMLKEYPEAKFKDALTETLFVIQQYIEKNLADISANEKTTKIKAAVKKEVGNIIAKPASKSTKSKTIRNDLESIHTKEELEFITKHKLTIDDCFNASGMSKDDRQLYAKEHGKKYYIGSYCEKGSHRLRTPSGHCIQCNLSAIAYSGRHSQTGYVYIQGSISQKLIKIGVTSSIKERNKSLNIKGYSYANSEDWEELYSVKTDNIGEIEHKAQKKLTPYKQDITYNRGDKEQKAQEVFRCPYSIAKAALDEALKGKPVREEKTLTDNLDKYEFTFR